MKGTMPADTAGWKPWQAPESVDIEDGLPQYGDVVRITGELRAIDLENGIIKLGAVVATVDGRQVPVVRIEVPE